MKIYLMAVKSARNAEVGPHHRRVKNTRMTDKDLALDANHLITYYQKIRISSLFQDKTLQAQERRAQSFF